MLKTRIVAALVFAPALLAVVVQGGLLLQVACAGLAALMVYEASEMLLPQAYAPIRLACYVCAALVAAYGFDLVPLNGGPLLPGTCLIVILLGALGAPGLLKDNVAHAAYALLCAWYGAGLIPLLWRLRSVPTLGLGLALMALFCTWAADTGAYFAGRAWGRHKLYPKVSPGKTLEGAAGGVLAAMAMAQALAYATQMPLTVPQTLTVGLIAATLGILGDLCESLLKRAAGVKDSSRFIPGHGGFLDRFDGVLFSLWGVQAYTSWLLGTL